MLVSMVVAGALTAGTAASVRGAALRVVQDPQSRFTISVPVNWNVQTSTKNPPVEAKAPARPGQLPDSVDVIVYDMPTPISPQSCVSQATTVMRFTIHNWTTLQETPTTIGGRQAYSRAYVWRARTGEERRSLQTCVTVGRRAFMVVGTTENTPSSVRQELPRLGEIMATLRPNAAAVPAPETRTPVPGGDR